MADDTDTKAPEPENDLEEAFGKEEAPPPEDLDKTVIRNADEGEEKTPKGKKPLPYLVIVEGPRSGTRFPLSEEKNVIGRSPGCAVRLDDQSVSRNHAEVTQVPGGWSVTDLGSKNGTVVNRSPVTEPVIIGHLDFIKVGIYLLRLVTHEVSVAEEMKLPKEMLDVERTDFVETPPSEGITGEEPRPEVEEEAEEHLPEAVSEGGPPAVSEPEPEPKAKPAPKSMLVKYRKMIAPLALGISAILVAVYYGQKYFFAEPEKPAKKPAVVEEVKPAAPGVPGTPTQPGAAPTQTMQVAPPPPPVQTVPLFLDFASSPLPAAIMFQGKDMGRAPIRVNVELEAGKQYEAEAIFEMPEVGEKYTQKISFVADPQQSVIPLLFRAPIGMIKVNDLPRDVQFYLEGRYEYDRFSERPAKLGEIVLRKPIYIPFGTYTLELRRARQLGASQTYVQDIVYRREFAMAADSPSQVFSVTDEDLRIFPVVVRSEPRNADVFIDGGPVGKTPYEGNFPLGEHTMTIRKEGYFEYTEVLKVDINTPFVTMVTLQTSVAGAHINNAIAAMNQQLYQKAINELAEALNSQPAPSEVAKANLLLGKCYFAMKDNERALQYFQLARQNAEQKDAALLGMVSVYAAANQKNMALPLLVEAMLNVKDENLQREANGLFMQISPFRSVIYVYSNPPGADVIVNDKKVTQQTPVILHEMSLGTYKLRVEKAGYLPVDLRLNLSVNEFNPVIVDLKPIPQ